MKKCFAGVLAAVVAGLPHACPAGDLVIDAFEQSGHITFDEVPNALGYRVEWTAGASGSWTGFVPSAMAGLNEIVAEGSGTITAAVPMLYRVVAETFAIPNDMTLIPAGTFVMGNATNVFAASEGTLSERPQHPVFTDRYLVDRYEVSKALWDEVFNWAVTNGYGFAQAGAAKAPNHPVNTVNWYDCVKWCNARSEREGLTPAYYTDAGFSNIYRTGQLALSNAWVHWKGGGYRLPTEAEWERAARGGVPDTRFPWNDYTNNISWDKANYISEGTLTTYDLSGNFGDQHPLFAVAPTPYTSPVDYFPPNGYGLHSMAANVKEWTWDNWDLGYYAVSPLNNPRGPAVGNGRVTRGGSWNLFSEVARVSSRSANFPTDAAWDIGFRSVRGF